MDIAQPKTVHSIIALAWTVNVVNQEFQLVEMA